MSPEQALGRPVDHRSDLFSMGVVMYEMATARLPFAGPTATETIERITHGQPEAIARFNYGLPPELDRIVRKCLEKDRERRYQSARELAVDLKNLQRDSDAAVGVGGKKVAATRKRPWAAIVAATATVLVAASVGAYLVGRRAQEPGIDSIAILPFANANADPNLEYLADGIPQSIINSLSQLPALKVMSHDSVFSFKGRTISAQEVGQKLGTRAVVTGRISQRAENLVINIEMVDARDNHQIWGQQYNRKLADVFAVQEEMAREISDQLRLKLTGTERQQLAKRPTGNLKAFEYYTLAYPYMQRRTRQDLLMAVDYCRQALAEDDRFALAYAGLSEAYLNLTNRGYIAPLDGWRQMEEAAHKAFELDGDLAEAHVALGNLDATTPPWNFERGDAELRRAITLKPSLASAHSYLGFSLVRQGRLDAALAEFLKAHELDRLSSITARSLSVPYLLKRDYPRALEQLRMANDLGPLFVAPWEAGIYISNRVPDEALAGLENEKRKPERQDDPMLIMSAGLVYAAQGNRAEALQAIKTLEAMSGQDSREAMWIAKVHAQLGDRDDTITWLERGFAARTLGIFYPDEPVWDSVRGDPRFTDLLRRMGRTT
jgi:TolB-like protein/Flp pilus assembly protein TadD